MPADSQTADLARRVRELELERRIRSLVEIEARKSEQLERKLEKVELQRQLERQKVEAAMWRQKVEGDAKLKEVMVAIREQAMQFEIESEKWHLNAASSN